MDHFMMNATSVSSTVALGGGATPDASVSNTTGVERGVESGSWRPYLSRLRDVRASSTSASSLGLRERRESRELRQRLLQIMSTPAVELRQARR